MPFFHIYLVFYHLKIQIFFHRCKKSSFILNQFMRFLFAAKIEIIVIAVIADNRRIINDCQILP